MLKSGVTCNGARNLRCPGVRPSGERAARIFSGVLRLAKKFSRNRAKKLRKSRTQQRRRARAVPAVPLVILFARFDRQPPDLRKQVDD